MMLTHRQCTVHLVNQTNFTLHDPSVLIVSGICDTPLPSTIGHSEAGSALFSKTPFTPCGAVAVFTYRLHSKSTKKDDRKMAVMFSVPYDFSRYSNWYAVGVFGKETQCDRALYEKMYYGAQESFIRGKASGPGLTYRGDDVTITANMTDTYQPVLTVDINISSTNRVTSQKKHVPKACKCCNVM